MTYPDFKDHVLSEMTDRYAGQASVSLTNVRKNNGVEVDGLVIHEEDVDLSPTIYLNAYYDMLLNGHSFDDVFNTIVNVYENHKNASFDSSQQFLDFSWVKKHVVMRLINKKKNADILINSPYIPFLDMALIFAVRIKVKSGFYGSAIIKNHHADFWETDAMELFSCAKQNVNRLLPPVCIKMSDLIIDCFPESSPFFSAFDPKMYIISNEERSYGASVVCYHHFVSDLAAELNDDLILIPSSVHEMIAVPMSAMDRMDILNESIREVNEFHLPPTQVLSDHAYVYRRDTDRITY